jgi:hypothetical protein
MEGLHITDHTISNKVQFLILETPLCYDVIRGAHYERITLFFR